MKKAAGFTLMELMIVVAIVGILAAIAYPSYMDSVRKSRRADAKAALSNAAQALERYYTEKNTYLNATLGDGAGAIFPDHSPSDQAHNSAYYILSITNQGASTYTLNATPTGTMTSDSCGTLTLDHIGQKGAALSIAQCW
jgi:type IV pilus assembly protein PilE